VRADPADGLTCVFGDWWSAESDSHLVIDGDCTDGEQRDIELLFRSPASTNADGADVEILAVGGEPGGLWSPPWWGWAFRKCSSREDCILP
jgi:hypothetical protein